MPEEQNHMDNEFDGVGVCWKSCQDIQEQLGNCLRLSLTCKGKQYLIRNLVKKRLYYFDAPCDFMRRYTSGIKMYAQLCTSTVPDGIKGEWNPETGYNISPVMLKNKKLYLGKSIR